MGIKSGLRKEIALSVEDARELTKMGKAFKLKLKPYIEKILSDHLIRAKIKKQ